MVMSKFVVRLSHVLLATAFFFPAAVALAVPKAAESEEEAVTFGEAGAPPKPVAKHVASAAKPPAGTVERRSAGKPVKHPGSKPSASTGTRSAAAAAKPAKQAVPRAQSGKPRLARKEARSTNSTGKHSAATAKASPAQQASAKKNGSARKK